MILSTQYEPSTGVACPFHKFLAPGDSSFTISVPKPFLNYHSSVSQLPIKRKFFFGSLRLVPDFFSRDAQLLDLDSDVDLNTRVQMQFHLIYRISPLLFTAASPTNVWEFETKPGTLPDSKIETLFDVLNKYSESAKPTGMVKAPFFLDWTEETFEQSVLDQSLSITVAEPLGQMPVNINDFVSSMSLYFYGEPKVNPAKHFDILQPSQRKVVGSNNYVFPSEAYENEELLSAVRIRLAVAPNTKILFSQKKMLTLLGFQPDKRIAHKFEFVNPSTDSYMYFVAEDPPTLNQYNDGKINAMVVSNVVVAPVQHLSMTLKEKRSNISLYKYLKKSIDNLSDQTNIDFGLDYNNTSETFKVIFPNNTGIKTTVYCDTDFSSRLGYGAQREINASDISVSVKNVIDKSASKAKVLSFDTGHVIVTCFNTSSNQTSISNNQYMASLLPDNAGMMTISPCVGEEVPTFVPPNYEQDGQNNVPLLCNLLKFNDLGEPVPFQWKTGAYISGILQGKL